MNGQQASSQDNQKQAEGLVLSTNVVSSPDTNLTTLDLPVEQSLHEKKYSSLTSFVHKSNSSNVTTKDDTASGNSLALIQDSYSRGMQKSLTYNTNTFGNVNNNDIGQTSSKKLKTRYIDDVKVEISEHGLTLLENLTYQFPTSLRQSVSFNYVKHNSDIDDGGLRKILQYSYQDDFNQSQKANRGQIFTIMSVSDACLKYKCKEKFILGDLKDNSCPCDNSVVANRKICPCPETLECIKQDCEAKTSETTNFIPNITCECEDPSVECIRYRCDALIEDPFNEYCLCDTEHDCDVYDCGARGMKPPTDEDDELKQRFNMQAKAIENNLEALDKAMGDLDPNKVRTIGGGYSEESIRPKGKVVVANVNSKTAPPNINLDGPQLSQPVSQQQQAANNQQLQQKQLMQQQAMQKQAMQQQAMQQQAMQQQAMQQQAMQQQAMQQQAMQQQAMQQQAMQQQAMLQQAMQQQAMQQQAIQQQAMQYQQQQPIIQQPIEQQPIQLPAQGQVGGGIAGPVDCSGDVTEIEINVPETTKIVIIDTNPNGYTDQIDAMQNNEYPGVMSNMLCPTDPGRTYQGVAYPGGAYQSFPNPNVAFATTGKLPGSKNIIKAYQSLTAVHPKQNILGVTPPGISPRVPATIMQAPLMNQAPGLSQPPGTIQQPGMTQSGITQPGMFQQPEMMQPGMMQQPALPQATLPTKKTESSSGEEIDEEEFLKNKDNAIHNPAVPLNDDDVKLEKILFPLPVGRPLKPPKIKLTKRDKEDKTAKNKKTESQDVGASQQSPENILGPEGEADCPCVDEMNQMTPVAKCNCVNKLHDIFRTIIAIQTENQKLKRKKCFVIETKQCDENGIPIEESFAGPGSSPEKVCPATQLNKQTTDENSCACKLKLDELFELMIEIHKENLRLKRDQDNDYNKTSEQSDEKKKFPTVKIKRERNCYMGGLENTVDPGEIVIINAPHVKATGTESNTVVQQNKTLFKVKVAEKSETKEKVDISPPSTTPLRETPPTRRKRSVIRRTRDNSDQNLYVMRRFNKKEVAYNNQKANNSRSKPENNTSRKSEKNYPLSKRYIDREYINEAPVGIMKQETFLKDYDFTCNMKNGKKTGKFKKQSNNMFPLTLKHKGIQNSVSFIIDNNITSLDCCEKQTSISGFHGENCMKKMCKTTAKAAKMAKCKVYSKIQPKQKKKYSIHNSSELNELTVLLQEIKQHMANQKLYQTATNNDNDRYVFKVNHELRNVEIVNYLRVVDSIELLRTLDLIHFLDITDNGSWHSKDSSETFTLPSCSGLGKDDALQFMELMLESEVKYKSDNYLNSSEEVLVKSENRSNIHMESTDDSMTSLYSKYSLVLESSEEEIAFLKYLSAKPSEVDFENKDGQTTIDMKFNNQISMLKILDDL